jgi:predicted PurR-regulated permease PerM
MKRIIFVLMASMALCSLTLAQNKTIAAKDSVEKNKVTVTQNDNSADQENSDATSTAEYTDTPDTSSSNTMSFNDDFPFQTKTNGKGLIPIIAIVMGIGLPMFIVFIAFYFRYKNKKAQYRLVEQALAAGQPIPESIFKQNLDSDIRVKGIKNIFLGLGLFIFLWALTGEFGLGCIGLLIMFTGLGQLVIHYTQESSFKGSTANRPTAPRQCEEKAEEKEAKQSVEE